jgi:hypothetical protein
MGRLNPVTIIVFKDSRRNGILVALLNLLEVLWSEYFLNCRPPLLVVIRSNSLHLEMLIHHIFYHKLKGLIVFCERNIQAGSVRIF